MARFLSPYVTNIWINGLCGTDNSVAKKGNVYNLILVYQ